MAGGEWRLGTASIYMGASYRSPPLRQAKSTQLHGYNSRPTKQIRQRYRPLNRAERGKLRLEGQHAECSRRTPPHTTHLRDFPRPVTILRERHPFEGRVLQALGATHRRGVALVLVVLPGGSRSLIPAGWTDLAAMPVAEPAAATENGRQHSLARLVDFLHERTILDALLTRVPSRRPK